MLPYILLELPSLPTFHPVLKMLTSLQPYSSFDHPFTTLHWEFHEDADYWLWPSCWAPCPCCPVPSIPSSKNQALGKHLTNVFKWGCLTSSHTFQPKWSYISFHRRKCMMTYSSPASVMAPWLLLENGLHNQMKCYFTRRESPRPSPFSWPQSSMFSIFPFEILVSAKQHLYLPPSIILIIVM